MDHIWTGDELRNFVIRAKKATYVGNGAKVNASRTGSHDLSFEDGHWTYRDSYFGGTDFLGQEVVWFDGQPVWVMNYYGYILRDDLITPTEAGNLLKSALGQPKAEGRLIDNFTVKTGHAVYEIKSSGDIARFSGRETICVGGILSYALDYHGGYVKN
jgi:Domain of unknown function (DUF5680)